MHCGIFIEERRPDTSDGEALQEALAMAEQAEAWGIDGVWLGEIHFAPERSVQSAPLALASFLAARTRRVRIGTAVNVLPLGNPLRIAEEVATVDQLSRGRFEFGVGRSGVIRTYDVFGIAYAESQGRFEESLQIIRQAWKGEPFSYIDTFPVVGRLGLPIFVGCRDLGIPELRVHLQEYRAAWRAAGHPGDGDVYLRIPIYASTTNQNAVDEPREPTLVFFRRQMQLTIARLQRMTTGDPARRDARIAELSNLSYEDILTTRVAFGTAERLIERIGELRDQLGLDGVIADMNPGGQFPLERQQRTLRVLTHEVMPALK